MHNALMDKDALRQMRADRLMQSRVKARYKSPTEAAGALKRKFGTGISTYLGHENGTGSFRADTAKQYAQFFGVRFLWLWDGEGSMLEDEKDPIVELYYSLPPELRIEMFNYGTFLKDRLKT